MDIWPDSVLQITCEITIALPQEEYYDRVILNGYSMDFSSFLKYNLLTDFTFIVNGRDFPVHSAILAARSTVFLALFTNEMIEKRKRKTVLTGIEACVFEAMLKFVYYGDLSTIDMMAEKFFIVADKYDIKVLRDLCKLKAYKIITAENVLDAYKFSDLYCLDKLKERSIDFIIENYSILKFSTDLNFKEFISQNPNLILLLLDKLII